MEGEKIKRRWGLAILGWLGICVLSILVTYLYYDIKYSLLSTKLGVEIKPSSYPAPWWIQLPTFYGFYAVWKSCISRKSIAGKKEQQDRGTL